MNVNYVYFKNEQYFHILKYSNVFNKIILFYDSYVSNNIALKLFKMYFVDISS